MLLLVLGGVGLFLVLKDDEPTTVATTQTIEQTTETSETEESSEETTEESTESTEENESDLINEGSPDAGAAFLDLVAAGDYPTAFGMLAEGLRSDYTDAQAFADDFFSVVGGTSITSSTLSEAFGHGDHDDLVFDLETDSGPSGVLLAVIEEGGELKVFDFASS
ncbi:MAG: hypothetical protein M3R66_12155 [Actinomycetota bacterium]|nr:hypothetical protein [Actinomycetota bacterium]